LARSLRAGLILPEALKETSGYTPAPLSRLFDRLTVALSLGESTRQSVQRVSDEARVTDFDLFSEVLILNSESGGNLPAMLDRLASSIRDRNQYRGYFRSVTALSRATAIFLALAMPVGLLIYRIFQPELLFKFLETSEGQTMLTAAVVLEILGVLWIAFLLRRQDDY
jgi:tight adherence protein B